MMLPNGWKKVKLGDVVKMSSGGTPSKDNASFWNGDIPWISALEMHKNFVEVAKLNITEDALKKGSSLAKKNDLLLLTRGSMLWKRIPVCLCLRDVAFNQDVKCLHANEKLNSTFLLYWFGCMESKIMHMVVGTGIGAGKLESSGILDLDVNLPPLEEQKKIAATLSVWDSAIEKMEKLIDAKESLLTEYGKELFGRTEQKQNENWSTIALSDVLNEHGDKSTGKEEVFSVSVHKGLVNQIEHLGRSFAAKDTSNYNRVHYGDIVYTKSPTGDFPLGIVKQSLIKEDVIVSPLYGVFTPKTFELGAILDFYFSSPINANNYLHPVAQKGAKNTINITNKKFLSAKLRLPIDIKEQKKIAQFVQTTKKEMAVLQEILENYKKQKQGLMQKLLTGQWR
ncbi:restriction endonuclease subunit S, partial [Fibrobacter sp.]|uniref:restriction endonuclease subunit S n=1 Tax=Fibrobacter sp. TaxID=35828 RepID=UPI0025BEF652